MSQLPSRRKKTHGLKDKNCLTFPIWKRTKKKSKKHFKWGLLLRFHRSSHQLLETMDGESFQEAAYSFPIWMLGLPLQCSHRDSINLILAVSSHLSSQAPSSNQWWASRICTRSSRPGFSKSSQAQCLLSNQWASQTFSALSSLRLKKPSLQDLGLCNGNNSLITVRLQA